MSTSGKFEMIREQQTAGPNVQVDNDAVLATLMDWDARYGIEISDAGYDRVMVHLSSMPDDLDAFAAEVYRFCPDVVDQHMAALWIPYSDGSKPPPHIETLLGDLDPDAEGYGLEILKRWIKQERKLPLWWD